MKVLIWIGSLIACAVAITLVRYAIGVNLIVELLLFGITLYIATRLCKKWDVKRAAGKDVGLGDNSIANNGNETLSAEEHKESEETDMKEELTDSSNVESSEQGEHVPEHRFCKNCGFELLEGSEYCSNCGEKVE